MRRLFYDSRKNSLAITLIAVFVCLFINAAFAEKSYAAIAGWGTEDQKSIVYGNTTYEGPKTNNGDIGGEGWQGGGGEIYFSAQGNKNLIIYFPKGTELNKDRSIGTSGTITEKDSGSQGGILGPRKDRILNSGQSITILPLKTSSALTAIQSIYKGSIGDYTSSLCADRNAALRSECQTSIGNKFEECWNRQVESRNFSLNAEKPGDSVNLETLAECISSESGLGKTPGYLTNLKKVQEQANTEGLKAFNAANPGDTKAEPTSCAIDGIGWIICPVSNFLASLVDNVFDLISGLLEVKVVSNTVSNSSLRDGWSTMLNIANVAFVIAFMVIIYSQLVGGGITNYTIKRMLPRLVMSAILVNLSFWICAIAVDISNILGYSTQDLLMSMRDNVTSQANQIPTWEAVTVNILSAGAIAAGIGGLAFGILTPAIMYGLLGILWPLLIAAIFSVLIALIVLTARQAIIVILIVISPLAFVAFLLPNTEKWFTRWRDLFATMLFMFPIISLVFGGSQYAAALIMASSPSAAVIIMALAVQVIPLALTPLILKFSGSLLSRIGGVINNPTKGPFDRLKSAGSKGLAARQEMAAKRNLAGEGKLASSFGGRMLRGRDNYRRKRDMTGKQFDATTEANWQERIAKDEKLTGVNNQTTAQAARGSEAQKIQKEIYLNALTERDADGNPIMGSDARPIPTSLLTTAAGMGEGAATSRILASVKAEERNETAKAIENVKVSADFKPGAAGLKEMGEELASAVKSGNTVEARAMQDLLLTSGQAGLNQWRKTMSTVDQDALTGETVTEMRLDLLSKHGGIKASAIDINTFGVKGGDIANDGSITSLESIQKDPSTYAMTDDEFAHQKASTQKLAISAGAVPKDQAARIINTPELSKLIESTGPDPVLSKLTLIANSTTPAPAATATQPINVSTQQQTTATNATTLIVPHTPPSATTPPATVNVTTTPVVVAPPINTTPPSGRRSSGAPFDLQGNSTRENTGTRAVVQPDDPTNTDINRFI